MSHRFKSFKPASQIELTLYLFIGESVCSIQHLEDALSHSLSMKMSGSRLRIEGDKFLEKNRSYTLGRAIGIAKQNNLYPESLLNDLSDILSERNWLIHKSIAHGRKEWDSNFDREKLLARIKVITNQASRLQQAIEDNMIDFAESKGVDMTRVRTAINKYYSE